MKKLILMLLCSLPLTMMAQRMGLVDDNIITQMPQYAEMKAQVQELSDKYKVEFEKLQADMDKKVTEFQALNLGNNGPENIRMLRMQEIQELNTRIQQFRNAAEADIKYHEETWLAPIQQQLQETINAVAAEGGYTVIYLKSAVAYTSPQVIDITPIVKARLGIE